MTAMTVPTFDDTLKALTAAYADFVLSQVAERRAAGQPIPPLADCLRGFDLFYPDHVFTRDELRFLTEFAEGDARQLVEAIPAERVPAEISGDWYELQHAVHALASVQAYLDGE